MFRNFLTALSVILMWTVFGSSPASSEEILGPWCFKPDPNNRIYNQIITITATDFGTYEAHIEMLFVYPQTFDLNKTSEDVFEVSGGLNQEGYRLVSAGNLEFYNIFETVGVAVKISEGQDAKDCFN